MFFCCFRLSSFLFLFHSVLSLQMIIFYNRKIYHKHFIITFSVFFQAELINSEKLSFTYLQRASNVSVMHGISFFMKSSLYHTKPVLQYQTKVSPTYLLSAYLLRVILIPLPSSFFQSPPSAINSLQIAKLHKRDN